MTLVGLLPTPGAARFLWFGKKKEVERVQIIAPLPRRATLIRPDPPLSGRTTCVDVHKIAGAQLFGDASVELTLQGGARWRMYFAQGCPALDFYRGFYYRRAEQGRLCAGRDAVISRAGGECLIASILQVRKPPVPKHRRRR
ncbi:hypothetical protein KX816_12930 [Sphingosinicellaceae bacterium]|nr:hypothetical protein KX816_12930 [Sphingosinicellaceae bacterium]